MRSTEGPMRASGDAPGRVRTRGVDQTQSLSGQRRSRQVTAASHGGESQRRVTAASHGENHGGRGRVRARGAVSGKPTMAWPGIALKRTASGHCLRPGVKTPSPGSCKKLETVRCPAKLETVHVRGLRLGAGTYIGKPTQCQRLAYNRISGRQLTTATTSRLQWTRPGSCSGRIG